MNKTSKKFSLLRVACALAGIFLIAFIAYEIIKYSEIKRIQNQILRELATTNHVIVISSKGYIGKLILKFIQDDDPNFLNLFPNETKNAVRINSQADIDKIISSIVLTKEEKGSCACNGSHYLGFYHDKVLLGIILVKHAELIIYINKKDESIGQYYLKKSKMIEIVSTLKKYKIDLK